MEKTIALLNCHGDDVYCFRKEIIDSLVERGDRVLISCPESSRLDIFRDNNKIIISDVKIDRRGTNPVNDLKLLSFYLKLFREYRPDVICSFTIKPNIYGSIAADILHIPHINNITGFGSGFQNNGFIQEVVKRLYKVALKNSAKIFFQNNSNKETALSARMICMNANYEVIPGSGVNLLRFHPNNKTGEKNIVIFNYIGRILKDKRIDDYLDAAIIIKKKYNNTIFNVIGFVEPTEMHYKDKLSELEKNGIIHYCGSVNDIRPYIDACDAIVHPSSYGEGMSNVLLETAASGRAIITTDIPGCYETVEDGINGFVYHAEDIAQLVNAIEKFLTLSVEERNTMGMMGRKRAEKLFDRKIVVNAYMNTIDSIINSKK